MNIKVISSSSKGNCYLLVGENDILIIECGVNFDEIKKGLDFDFSKVVGCIITHEHKDHSKSMGNMLVFGIPVYTSLGTAGDLSKHHNMNIVESKKTFAVGEFKILPFDVTHDAREPLGFMIQFKNKERLLFATDTKAVKYKFKGITCLLVEMNHSLKIMEENVEKGFLHPALKKRIVNSHMGLEVFKRFILDNDFSKVRDIILIHLSEKNSNGTEFKKEIELIINSNVVIAKKGLEINLDKYPF